MPAWNSNDPSSFGWSAPPARVVPFVFRGHSFPGGIHPLAARWFAQALEVLCQQPGFQLHQGAGLDDGDWGYEYRQTKSGNALSFHAYALALDINAPWNPYGQNEPDPSPYRLPANTRELVRPFGLLWGGGPEWGNTRDWMHLELHFSPGEAGAGGPPAASSPPFPLPSGMSFGPTHDGTTVNGSAPCAARLSAAIKLVQTALGTAQDGLYGPHTYAACIGWQRAHGLNADGLTGPLTWAALL